MKKHILLLCCMIAFGLSVFANDPPKATYRCKLPGTYDYVTVDYFNEGKGQGYLVFANQSNMVITRMRVKVEVTDYWDATESYNYQDEFGTWQRGERTVTKTHTAVLCDDTFYDIATNRSDVRRSSSRGPVKGGNEKPGHDYKYTVTVIDDPICKPLE